MPELPGNSAEDVVRDHLELGMVGVLLGTDVSGAGFLIDARHVITCAHTVNDVLGRGRYDKEQPGEDVELNFPFADRQRNVKANVVAWRPVGDGHNDIAVLHLREHPPPGARPVRLVSADLVAGHRFVAWGFPLENAGEMYAEGIIQRRRGDDRIQVVGTEVTGQAVRRGFSGTAVWDEVLVVETVFEGGIAACYLRDVAKAEEAAVRIDAMLRKEDPPLWWAGLADLHALTALLQGDYPRALAEVERGIVCYVDSPEQDSIGYLVNIRGLVLLAQGRTKEAATEFIAVREDAAAIRYARLEGFAALNLAWAQLSEGNRQAATATARKAADLLAASRVRETESARALAEACEAGEQDAMLQRLRLAVRTSQGNPDLYQPSEKVLVNLAIHSLDNPRNIT